MANDPQPFSSGRPPAVPADTAASTAADAAAEGDTDTDTVANAATDTTDDEALIAEALREHAENLVRGRAPVRHERLAVPSPAAARDALHELQVHQLELEMQNDELRRAQLELEASRTRYFELYDLAPVGYCTVSAEGLILQANLAAASLFGVARGLVVRKPFSRFVLPADADRWQFSRQQLAKTARPQTLELRLAPSDGAPQVTVQVAASAAPDAGVTSLLRVVLTDVTERKLMETAMRESEDRYRALVEWSPDAVVVHQGGKIIYANPVAGKMFGATTATPLAGRPILEIIHPDFQHTVLARLQQITAHGGGSPQMEVCVLRLDRTPFEVEAQSTSTVYDGRPVFITAMRDISERKRAEAALRASEESYRALFDSSLDAILLTTPDGRILAANGAACRLFAQTEPELEQSGRDAVVDGADPRLAAALAELALHGHFSGELNFIRKGGVRFPGELSSANFTDADGQARTSMIVRDVSVRTRAREALQGALREKEALLKEVHHRVKNNLQMVHSLLRLETGRNPQPEVKQVLRAMQARIVSMALLHETLYRSGSFAAVDLGHYLQELTTQAFQALAAESGAVKLQLDLASAQVATDQAVACGLLVNELVSNCLKHAFPGGRAGTLRVALQPVADSASLRLSVSDDGVGLPAEFEARGGQSLGLQLAEDLAQQLGGSLNFSAERGCSVELIFAPQRARAATESTDPDSAKPAP